MLISQNPDFFHFVKSRFFLFHKIQISQFRKVHISQNPVSLTCRGVANVLLSVTELLSDLVSNAFDVLFTSVSTWTSFCTSSICCFVSKILDTIFSDSCISRSISVNLIHIILTLLDQFYSTSFVFLAKVDL